MLGEPGSRSASVLTGIQHISQMLPTGVRVRAWPRPRRRIDLPSLLAFYPFLLSSLRPSTSLSAPVGKGLRGSFPMCLPTIFAQMHCAGSSVKNVSMAKRFAEDRKVVSKSGKVSALLVHVTVHCLTASILCFSLSRLSSVCHCSRLYFGQLFGIVQSQHVSMAKANGQHDPVRSIPIRRQGPFRQDGSHCKASGRVRMLDSDTTPEVEATCGYV